MISELVHFESSGILCDPYNEEIFTEKPELYLGYKSCITLNMNPEYKFIPERTTFLFQSDQFIYATIELFDAYYNNTNNQYELGIKFYDNVGNGTDLYEKNADVYITLYFDEWDT